MHVRSGTTVVSLIRAKWGDYSCRQLELSPDFQSLPTQNIYIEKLAGRDWKNEELGESSNYSIISKTVAHTLIYSILFTQQSKVRLSIPFEMETATVREWNSLNLSVRNLDTSSKFKRVIRSSSSMPILRHYSYVPRKLNIILAHLRCNASFLNYD
jgi:hypothetical protein